MSDSLQPHELYVAHEPLPSMEFSRQEYWSGVPFPSAQENSGQIQSPGRVRVGLGSGSAKVQQEVCSPARGNRQVCAPCHTPAHQLN